MYKKKGINHHQYENDDRLLRNKKKNAARVVASLEREPHELADTQSGKCYAAHLFT